MAIGIPGSKSTPKCHPNNKYQGKGLCVVCYLKQYRKKHKKEIRELQRLWVFSNPEKHKASSRKASATRRKNNPEESLKYAREYREKYPERVQHWRQENIEKLRGYTRHRRALKAGNGGSFTNKEWINLKAEHDNKCLCCGRTEAELSLLNLELVPDHILSVKMSKTLMLSLGFLNSIKNIQPLCHAHTKGSKGGCNNQKGAQYVDYRGH